MPDQVPTLPPVPTIPLPAIQDTQKPLSAFDAAYMRTQQQMGSSRNTNWLATPMASTRVKDAERYTDPELGFNVFDPNQEQRYADKQSWYSAIGNTLAKTGYATLSSLGQTIAAIPYTLSGIVQGKLSLAYNNDLVNTLDEWGKDLETTLPNYQTQFQKDHPYWSYLNPFYLHSFVNSWGGVLKNVGYTAGAIGGSLVIDSLVGAATAGTGDAALIPTQAARISEVLSKTGAAEDVTGLAGKAAKIYSSGSQRVAELSTAMEAGEDIQSAVNRVYNAAKLKNGLTYGFNLFNTALSIGTLTANQTYNDTKEQLVDDYKQKYGTLPTGDDWTKIESNSISAGNSDLIINTGLTMATDALSFGSLLKPTSMAQRAVEKEIAANTELKLGNLDTWEKVNPTKGFKGILTRGASTFTQGEFGKSVVGETLKGGLQMATNSANTEFWKRKYEDESMDTADDLVHSIGKGLSDTFLTDEGKQNLLMFALNGPVIHGIKSAFNRVTGLNTSKTSNVNRVVDFLNQNTLTGIFDHKYNELTNAVSISKDMNNAALTGDIFQYKNLKQEALYNFVLSGVKSNRFGLRMQQLDGLKDLNEQQFKTMFQMDYTEENRKTASQYVDAVKAKAFEVKKDIDKVEKAFGNPFHRTKEAVDHGAYESYKDALGISLSQVRDGKERITALGNDLKNLSPTLFIDSVSKLSNVEGIKQTVDTFTKRIAELRESEQNVPDDPELRDKFKQEREFLEESVEKLQGHLDNPDPDSYVKDVKPILDYYANGDVVDGSISHNLTDVVDILKTSGDIYKNKVAVDNSVDAYNRLISKKGYDGFMDTATAMTQKYGSRITINPDGTFAYKTPEQEAAETLAQQMVDSKPIEQTINEQNPPEQLTKEEDKALDELVKAEEKGTPLSEEQEQLKKDKPQAYVNKKKALQKVKNQDKYFGQTFEDTIQPLTPEEYENKRADVEARREAELKGASKDAELPQELKGAKPKYNYGSKRLELAFDSDLDKAAYIVAANTKSDRHDDYMQFLKDKTGMTEAQIKKYGQAVRDHIKSLAKDASDGETLKIGKQSNANPKDANKINAKYDKELAELEGRKPETPAQQEKKASAPTIATDVKYGGTSPTKLLNYIDTREFSDDPTPRKQNLHTVLFKEGKQALNNLTIKLRGVTHEKGLKPGDFKNLTSSIYRGGHDKDIVIFHEGNEVGRLNNDLYFKRGAEFVRLDKLTPDEYVNVTRNDPATYDNFMNEVKPMMAMVDRIRTLDKDLSAKDVRDLIGKITPFYGYIDDVKANGVKLGDANYIGENSYVLSYPKEYDPATKAYVRTKKPIIIGENGIEELPSDLEKSLSSNQDKIGQLDKRYIVAMRMPDGTFTDSSFIAARPIDQPADNLDALHVALQGGHIEMARAILSDLYITDSGIKPGQKTDFGLVVNDNGDVQLNISKRMSSKGMSTIGRVSLTKEEVASSDNFQDLTKKLQQKIDNLASTDKKFRNLEININPQDFKQNIPTDENTKFGTFKDKLTISTTPNVFRDFGLYVYPHAGLETGTETVKVGGEEREVPKSKLVVNETEAGPATYIKEPNGEVTLVDKKSSEDLKTKNENQDKYDKEVQRLQNERRGKLTETEDLKKLDEAVRQGIKFNDINMSEEELADAMGKRKAIIEEYKSKIDSLKDRKSKNITFETKEPTQKVAVVKSPVQVTETPKPTPSDPRLTPAQPGAYGHYSTIQQTLRNGEYSRLIMEGVPVERILPVIESVYGDQASTIMRSIKWQSNPDNIKRMDNIANWTDFGTEDHDQLMYEILRNGNLRAAVENDFLPIQSALELVTHTPLPEDIVKLINNKATESSYKNNVEGEIADAQYKENKQDISALQEEVEPERITEGAEPITGAKQPEKISKEIGQGDRVYFKGKEYVVDDIDEDGMHRLNPIEGGRKEWAFPQMLQKIEPEEDTSKYDPIYNVVEKFQAKFPGIKIEVGDFSGTWKGKFDKGTVKINRKYATLDTPIHEYMHPFILAIKNENPKLYKNASDELKSTELGRRLIEEVKQQKEYENNTPEEHHDEALVRYISQNIADVLDKDGNIDEEKLESKRKGFIDVLYDWLRRIRNLIIGVDKNVKYDQFVDRLQSKFGDSYNFIKKNEPDEDYRSKFLNLSGKPTVIINESKYGRNTLPDTFFDEIEGKMAPAEYQKLLSYSDQAIRKGQGANETAYKDFNRITYSPKSGDLRFFKPGEPNASRIISSVSPEDLPKHIKNVEDLQSIRKLMAETGDQKIEHLIPERPAPVDVMDNNRMISVRDIPGNINASQLADLLTQQEFLQFDLSSQQNALNQMEAFQYATNVDADAAGEKLKQQLEKKIAVLEDIAKKRIHGGSDVLNSELYKLKALNRDFDGAELLAQYVKSGVSGLDFATNNIKDIYKLYRGGSEPKADERTEALRKFTEAKTFLGMYDDVDRLFGQYDDLFGKDESDEFNKVIDNARRKRDWINSISADLATSWLYPVYADRMQEVIRRNPGQSDLMLSKEDFKNKLRMADKDASMATFWLGATINSRDPINASVALAVNSDLLANHIEEDKVKGKRDVAFDQFLKTSGIANNAKALEDYYKKNFIHKIDVWEITGYDSVKKEAIEGYKQRWAFHEPYHYDKYEDNFRKLLDGLPDPLTQAQHDANFKAIKDWHDKNSVVLQGGGYRPSDIYKNADYDKIKDNVLFNQLYDTYKKGNELYGDKSLKYGMIPQAHKEGSIIGKVAETAGDLRSSITEPRQQGQSRADYAKMKAKQAADYFVNTNQESKPEYKNFDSSYYRPVKTNYIRPLEDNQLDMKLHETVLNMFRDANTYHSLRDRQADAENIKDLISGNEKLGITARKIAKTDRTGQKVFDIFSKTPQGNQFARKLNDQLVQYINDQFFGEKEFQQNIQIAGQNFNMNKISRGLRQYVTADIMMFNVIGGIRSATARGILSYGEAVGGRNFKQGTYWKAVGEYTKNMPEFIKDFERPIKSLYAQLGTHYDFLQGETRRTNYGGKITGGAANRLMSTDSLHFVTHSSEHMVQFISGLAHLDSIDVPTKSGKKMTLKDAWIKDKNGLMTLHPDAIWSESDDAKAALVIQNLNRRLHGNYSDAHKSVLQRYWWGNLALIYRKYVYENVRQKFSGERVDLESGDIEQGYYRGFAKRLLADMKDYKYNMLKVAQNQGARKGWSERDKYYANKTIFDIGAMTALFMGITALTPPKGKAKNMDKSQAYLLLLAHAAYGDIAAYSVDAFGETKRQLTNPTSAIKPLSNFIDVFDQLVTAPNAQYDKNGVGYKAGDSKLGRKARKAVPILGTFYRIADPKTQLQFYGNKAYN